MTATPLVANPALIVVDEDPDLLGITEQALGDRYGRDYRVEAFRSAAAALERLEQLEETQQQVALVLSSQSLTGMTGEELLKAVHRLHPHAKRALVIAWRELGDVPTGRAVFSAIATGRIDHYVIRPFRPPDESFHHAISSFLLEWSEAMRIAPHTIQVIGASWSGRAMSYARCWGAARCRSLRPRRFVRGASCSCRSGRRGGATAGVLSGRHSALQSDQRRARQRDTGRRDAQVQRVRRGDRRRRTSRAVGCRLWGIRGVPDPGRRPRRHWRTSDVELVDPQLPRFPSGSERRAPRPASVRAGVDPRGPVRIHAAGDRPRA